MASNNIGLLIIDPQVDFHPGGSCAIPNAENVSIRIADLIANHGANISQIYVALDTHHRTHISNPLYWKHGETGEAPKAWTVINSADVENEVWRPRLPANLQRAAAYTEQLEALGKPSLLIWPEHCLLGTKGSACTKIINDAIQEWAGQHPTARIEYLIRGTNTNTEMYSIFEAEVPDPEDPDTSFNMTLLERLQKHDQLLVTGFSLSHSIGNNCTSDTLKRLHQHRLRP